MFASKYGPGGRRLDPTAQNTGISLSEEAKRCILAVQDDRHTRAGNMPLSGEVIEEALRNHFPVSWASANKNDAG